MDRTRTSLLAQNGVPGEYTVSYPFLARGPRSEPRLRVRSETQQSTTQTTLLSTPAHDTPQPTALQRRASTTSTTSLASLACLAPEKGKEKEKDKENAKTPQAQRSGVKTVLAKAVRGGHVDGSGERRGGEGRKGDRTGDGWRVFFPRKSGS
ncbi:uncharacterized protein EKO05_0001849 [Ascochyta rabiei]|uniref:uncharacterized protein n=1 Tax=Didymella rabiei TaxID=5454 RepID=UPI0022013855|nr:uncharacterized protein EKO05_0001849 [Ascochyta rabiei]UPX11232.1 hypothetical protein EKO05_0001849 [Ascochyta rabiei]